MNERGAYTFSCLCCGNVLRAYRASATRRENLLAYGDCPACNTIHGVLRIDQRSVTILTMTERERNATQGDYDPCPTEADPAIMATPS